MKDLPFRKKASPSGRQKRLDRDSGPQVGGCTNLNPLGQLAYYLISLDVQCRLFVARRTPVQFERLEDIEACFREIERMLSHVSRRRYRLLVDTRSGPSRNDERFEAALKEHRGKLLFGFGKNAALAATAAGRLQIQRFAKADGRQVFATEDPGAAFQYLGVPDHHLPSLPALVVPIVSGLTTRR